MSAESLLSVALWLLIAGTAAYLLLALASVLAFRPHLGCDRRNDPNVTVLRPLCGDEHGLAFGLESLLSQEMRGQVRFVFGVESPRDPALTLAKAVAARHPDRCVEFVDDPRMHGANPKVSNLINMSAGGLDEVVVISDSDAVLCPGSLQGAVDALARPEVGAATALFRGRPGGGSFAQRLGALYLDGWFLPTALLHARLGGGSVCYGALTAIKRDVLESCGGLDALRDALADDTELGHFARRAGREVVFAPHVVETWVNDASLGNLFRHELRWAKTIKALQPCGYFASIFMHSGPLPLLLTVLEPGLRSWLAVLGLALLRWGLVVTTHQRLGRAEALKSADPLTLWLRDQLYFAVWLAGFFGTKISWRARALRVSPGASLEEVGQALGSPGRLREA